MEFIVCLIIRAHLLFHLLDWHFMCLLPSVLLKWNILLLFSSLQDAIMYWEVFLQLNDTLHFLLNKKCWTKSFHLYNFFFSLRFFSVPQVKTMTWFRQFVKCNWVKNREDKARERDEKCLNCHCQWISGQKMQCYTFLYYFVNHLWVFYLNADTETNIDVPLQISHLV